MSADNAILIVRAPKREEAGKDFLVFHIIGDCYFDDESPSDLRVLSIARVMRFFTTKRFASQDGTEEYAKVLLDENGIVEYGICHLDINIPLPNEADVIAAKMRMGSSASFLEADASFSNLRNRFGKQKTI